MNNPLENFRNPFDIDGSFAQKILNTDRIFGNTNKILDIPNEENKEDIKPPYNSVFYHLNGQFAEDRIFVKNNKGMDSDVYILNPENVFDKLRREQTKIGKIFGSQPFISLGLTHKELLDRATWIVGESGTETKEYTKYAHSMQNAIKLGIHGTGKPPYSSFESMREVLMQDQTRKIDSEGRLLDANGNIIGEYGNNNPSVLISTTPIKISMAQYKMRTSDTRGFSATFENPNIRTETHKKAISAVIESILSPDLDPTPKLNGVGTNAWGGGHSFYHSVNINAGSYGQFFKK